MTKPAPQGAADAPAEDHAPAHSVLQHGRPLIVIPDRVCADRRAHSRADERPDDL